MNYRSYVYDAWLAAAEIPYDWLIPLLHEKESSEKIYSEIKQNYHELQNLIPASCLRHLAETADSRHLDAFALLMEKHAIRSITIEDKIYPHILRKIDSPPGLLFYRGRIECLKETKTVSMVGSRSASYNGLKAARKISMELSRNHVTVISGMAYGIDSECHMGCLEGGSPTIAVLGCGLDQNYPTRNDTLKEKILESGGLLLSEYAPGVSPLGWHFPYRNRIISGLSAAVILIEARIRSGSMTTIEHALKQGKEVYAYPGDPVSPLSEANRMLLREGAHYFTTAADILEDMNWLDNLPHVRQNIDCSATPDALTGPEKVICSALLKGELGFDELLQATGLSSSALMSTITVLQIKRKIELLPGKKYKIRQD